MPGSDGRRRVAVIGYGFMGAAHTDAGSGALGDTGAHVIDLAQYLTGEKLGALGARGALSFDSG